LLLKASPLILVATGLAVGFRANVWNIGAEGQLAFGAVSATWLALTFPDGGAWLLPAMIIFGAIGGMAWASITAALRSWFNANEILVSLMLTYVALLLVSYLVNGPWRDPMGFNFPQSPLFSQTALYPLLIPGTRLNGGVLVTLLFVLAAWIFVAKSFLAFKMQIVGLSERSARYAGFGTKQAIWVGMLVSGAAAGLAGVGEVSGPLGQLLPNVSSGYGFTAIIVAFVGRLHPLGIVIAGLLLALLQLGGDSAQIELGMPAAIVSLFQGLLLILLLASDVLIKHRVELRLRRADTLLPGAPS
jgi:simple sugar transport system permease protein